MPPRPTFDDYVRRLHAVDLALGRGEERDDDVGAMLDGEARRTAREVIPSADLKKWGAFFTSSSLRQLAWGLFRDPLKAGSVVLDPAVGAGDLLLGAFDRLPTTGTIELLGYDLHQSFLEAARARLAIASKWDQSHGRGAEVVARLRKASGLVQQRAIERATHIVMNPPYIAMQAQDDCSWARGSVNAAAVFLDVVVSQASSGTEIVAIVPDVLRSGTRYASWRTYVEERAHVLDVTRVGRFDEWTDVDVIMLHLRRRDVAAANAQDWGSLADLPDGQRLDDTFQISVGSVVDYRSPEKGHWQPYLIARDAPRWGHMREVSRRRRFAGKLVRPPFVVVRRTSSPSDKDRAVATIVNCKEDVAVENHLLVARPNDGTVAACKRLLDHLHSPSTNRWLNKVIACRHLTVGALGSLPW